jgi:hypothetical protein
VIQSCDCYVDRNGLMYVTDPNAGLNILQFEGELSGQGGDAASPSLVAGTSQHERQL